MSRARLGAVLVVAALGCAGGEAEPADGGPASPDASGLDGAQLYADLCASCHGEVGEGGLGPALVDWSRGEDDLRTIIETRMPQGRPADCGPACAVAVARYVLEHLTSEALACDEVPPSPRRLRLLSRREYRNTIWDLFPELRPSAGAPETEDDDCNLQRFVYDPGGRTLASVHLAGSFNGWSPDAWPMTRSTATGRWEIERRLEDGTHEYKLVLDGSEWITDPDNPDSVDDRFGGRNSVRVVDCAGSGAAGGDGGTLDDPAAGFPPETRPEGFPFDDAADHNRVTAVHVSEYLSAAKRIVEALGNGVTDLVPCDGATDPEVCAATFASDVGRRVFRRPLSDDEVGRYRDLASSEPRLEDGLAVALRAMLVSPHFLYRSELGEPAGDGTFRLTPWEVATALSYGLWGTTPDDALLDAAESGELATPEGIEREARRLLDDPRSRRAVRAFAHQWLGVESVATAPKSEALYPDVTDALRAAMLEETARFVEHVVFDSTGRFDELLTADYSFANADLAELYDSAGPTGDELERMPHPDDRRAGILGHAAVLARYAHSDQTSPIQRGLFVRRDLLCQTFPRPPANAGGVPDVDPEATTLERFRQHTDDPACSSCHQYIDPVGFGFERFDAVGAWRETENGRPIEARGNMNDVEGLGTGTDAPFDTLSELGAILAESDAAHACFVRQWFRFARGYRETADDRCALRRLEERFRASGGDVRELLVEIALSPDFTRRR